MEKCLDSASLFPREINPFFFDIFPREIAAENGYFVNRNSAFFETPLTLAVANALMEERFYPKNRALENLPVKKRSFYLGREEREREKKKKNERPTST